jgi:hypothetical protein
MTGQFPPWFLENARRMAIAPRARRGDLLAIAQVAAWKAEDALNRYFTAKRIAYSEGRNFIGRPAAAQL